MPCGRELSAFQPKHRKGKEALLFCKSVFDRSIVKPTSTEDLVAFKEES